MRGCTWDGLTTVPARNVASLTFGKVVAVPAAPHAGKPFLLNAGVTRSDSAAKIEQRHEGDLENPYLAATAVTVNGENVPLESVEGCSQCLPPGDPESRVRTSTAPSGQDTRRPTRNVMPLVLRL